MPDQFLGTVLGCIVNCFPSIVFLKILAIILWFVTCDFSILVENVKGSFINISRALGFCSLDFYYCRQVLNRSSVTIIKNAALGIISTKMNVYFLFQFDSVLAFFKGSLCKPI